MTAADVAAFIESLAPWHWFIAAAALVVLEVLAPGVIFLWLAIAGVVTGIVVVVEPALGWEAQVLIFAVLSVISAVGGRIWIKSRPTETDHPTLNRRGERYVGRQITLDEPVSNGVGKAHLDDTMWKVAGPDLAAGTVVTVVGVEGTVLRVEPVATDGNEASETD